MAFGVFQHDYQTQAANTVITELISPAKDYIARVTGMRYRVAGTAHTLTFMRPIAQTTTSAAAAASQKDMVLTDASPEGGDEALAASDYLVWEDTNGVYQFDLIASVSSSTMTMTSNLPTAVDSGATVWAMYEVGRASHVILTPAASATFEFNNSSGIAQGGITAKVDSDNVRNGRGDPLIFHSTNATAQGFLDYLVGEYVNDNLIY